MNRDVKEYIEEHKKKKNKSKLFRHKAVIFEMREAGAGLSLIAKYLHEKHGVKTSISNLYAWMKRNEKDEK